MESEILAQTNRVITITETILSDIEDAELSFETVKGIHTFKQLKNAFKAMEQDEESRFRLHEISRSIANSASQAVNMVRKEISISEKKSNQINLLEKQGDKLRLALKNTRIKYSNYYSNEKKSSATDDPGPSARSDGERASDKDNSQILNSLRGSIQSLYSEVVEEVENKRNEVNELLGQLTEGTLSKSYEEEAQKELKSADSLRTLSLMCMGLMVILAIVFWAAHQENSSWPDALYRLVTILTLSIPATYLARESSRHRENQKAHLQTALDIKSITPFIASLPPEQQNEIRGKIAEQVFSPNSKTSFETNDTIDKTIYHSLLDLAKQVKT
ncbi:MAG: hypothetical protein RIB86_02885, partial [Imperialibacter sp.]